MPYRVPGIYVFAAAHQNKDVDGRDKPGHDNSARGSHIRNNPDKLQSCLDVARAGGGQRSGVGLRAVTRRMRPRRFPRAA
jgi:hypothetical protein